MALGSYGYGSTSYGGLAPNRSVREVQALTLTLQVPIWIAKHSVPAFFASNLTVEAPTIHIKAQASLQSLSLTEQAPNYFESVSVGTQALSLTLQTPVQENRKVIPATLDLTVSFSTEETEVKDGPALFNLTLTLQVPTAKIIYRPRGSFAPFKLVVSAGFAPTIGSLAPRIVRYIKDPIVVRGCPQCGTLLYNEGPAVRSGSISSGRNFDDGKYDDSKYVRCARCGWICNVDRDAHDRRGSTAGWGVRYTEIEAGS